MDGATNGAWFLSSVDDVLVPALKPGDTAVMDDLSAYKVKGGRDAVEAAGVRLLGFPAYSPDFQPDPGHPGRSEIGWGPFGMPLPS